MNMVDIQKKAVRSSAVLTGSYVAGTIVEPRQSHNQMITLVNFTKGSLDSLEIKVEFAYEKKVTLAYDNQTNNFTAGDEIIGRASGATGIIEADNDGGATGTLTLTGVKGTFFDNENIIDKAGREAGGLARVNGDPSDGSDWFQETFSAITTTTDTISLGVHQTATSGLYEIETPMLAPRVRVSVKGTGTVTSSLVTVDVVTGRV